MFGTKLRPVRAALSPTTVALFAAAFAATPALAHGPQVSIGIEFEAPVRIEARTRNYASYRVGHAWYGPHAHAHVIFAFPVRTSFGVVYRPFTYCDGRLVRTDYVPGYDPRYDDLLIGYDMPVFDGPAYHAGYLAPVYYEAPWRRGRDRYAVHVHGRRGHDRDDDHGWKRGHREERDHARHGDRYRHDDDRDRRSHRRHED